MYYNINSNRDYLKLKKSLGENPRFVLVRNICNNAKVNFVSTFSEKQKLIVLPDERSAILFYEDGKFYDKNIYYFGEKDLLFATASIDDEKILRDRTNILKRLLNKEKITVVTTISATLEKLPSISNVLAKTIKVVANKEIAFETFVSKLINIGYKRVSVVESVGEFSIRGGIVDIYEVSLDDPVRIEFIGDIVESIRYFNINTKRSTENINSIEIFPITDNNNLADNTFILDYFMEDALVFIDEPKRITNKIELIIDMLKESIESRKILEKDLDYDDQDKIKPIELFPSKYVLDRLSEKNCIQLTSIDDPAYVNEEKFKDIKSSWDYEFDFNMITPVFDKKDYEGTKNVIKDYLIKDFSGIIVLNSRTRAERFVKELQDENVNAYIVESLDNKIPNGAVGIFIGELSSGFIDEVDKFFIFTEKDLFGIEPERKRRILKNKHRDGYVPINDLGELKLGDYIIHENYGVGVFKGITRLEVENVEKDYVKVEYADGGFLYVLATKLESLERYASKSAIVPKLNKLGSNDFIKLKKKVKLDILETAKDLIELYARRHESKGYIFSVDSIWQREFEETFPYIETYDQLLAIEAVKNDMQSNKTMDRLICGDVGFGKTEVAIRAAFKAVQDGKQVAYLVPTTVLCMQHYKTFSERFEKYPVKISFLSRFNKKKDNDEVVEKLKSGGLDIVIGTHRLLSKDVEFKNLGLLIIDEEQRFGVSHKEKIKKLKNNVDVLTLTATPIPRTLYMSLSGIRDMSMLTEAPPERMPIKTYVLEYNEELIREAINRELKRDGQVFVVHNKVSDIYAFADRINAICPYAKIAVVHGKLKENELSETMLDFIDKKYDVLITTTIIETGIDIQNANTLIIDSAEQFGLSQLYQLRGRVGRSDRTAYAFFMYRKNKELTDDELARLKAIKENTALGSGLKIAMRDLEMRGAGNILGLSQSGHIDAVGYDLYIKMLNEAIKYLKDNKKDGDNIDGVNTDDYINGFDTIVDIDIDAYIPANYIEDEETKLSVYRKISKCEKEEEFDDLKVELKDRFGDFPKELENLIFIAKLKIKAHKLYVTHLYIKRKLVSITFAESNKIDGQSVMDIVTKFCGAIRVINGKQVTLTYRANPEDSVSIDKSLRIAENIINSLKLQ
ncbi:MAG: transcription-repair coupling factor [Lachnospiraceae bacterium]|nr:transcription-repair coupling factor [Lachnospiraceae bacterium]